MVVALLLGLGGGLAMFMLIAALTVPLQRWSDRTGYHEGRRQAPLGKSLVLIAFICVMSGLGTGFIYAGRVDGPRWLIVPGLLLYLVMIAAAAIIGARMGRRGAPRSRRAGPPTARVLPRHAPAPGADLRARVRRAVALPPTGIVLIILGKTVIGLALLAFGIVLWIAMLRLRPKRRGAWPTTPSP